MKFEISCKKHPRYLAKRQPRGCCNVCWAMYDMRQAVLLATPLPETEVMFEVGDAKIGIEYADGGV